MPAMAINDAVSTYCGPGGSARRLHQEAVVNHVNEYLLLADGGEPGSTCIESCLSFARDGTAVMGHLKINANDNDVEFAVAA